MIPVPHEMLTVFDFSNQKEETKRALSDELAFCKRNRDRIFRKANETYNAILNSNDKNLLGHSCDFRILEQAYREFCQIHSLDISLPNKETASDMNKKQVADDTEKAEPEIIVISDDISEDESHEMEL